MQNAGCDFPSAKKTLAMMESEAEEVEESNKHLCISLIMVHALAT
jgi:hypothetical protein